MTCRPLLVQTRDVLRPGVVLWMAWCPQCRWDGPERSNHDMARIDLSNHHQGENT